MIKKRSVSQMKREIIRDEAFLAQKAEPATTEDLSEVDHCERIII